MWYCGILRIYPPQFPNKDEKIWIKFITSLVSCKWQKESCFTLLENSCTCSLKKNAIFHSRHGLFCWTFIVSTAMDKLWRCLGLARCLNEHRYFQLNLTTWVWSLEPTEWMGRISSCKVVLWPTCVCTSMRKRTRAFWISYLSLQ